MEKKQKENIKRIVGEGLSLILNKLKISNPSSKTESALKKLSKKLTGHLKTEVKKGSKKKMTKHTRNEKGTQAKSQKLKGAIK
jgi:hypothetical protein